MLACELPLAAAQAAANVDDITWRESIDALVSDGLVQLRVLDAAGHAPDTESPSHLVLAQPIREYAASAMAADDARATRGRLRDWWLARLAQAPPPSAASLAVNRELLQLLIISAHQDGRPEQTIALACAMPPFWFSDAPTRSVLTALEQSLPAACNRAQHLELLDLLVGFRLTCGDAAQAVAHVEALRALTPLDDDGLRGLALVRWVVTTYATGQLDADFDTALAEAQACINRTANPRSQFRLLDAQALLLGNLKGDIAGSEALYAQAQQLMTDLGDTHMARFALLARAVQWASMGRVEQAIDTIRACEAGAVADGSWRLVALCAQQLGRVLVRERQAPQAVAAFHRSLRACEGRGLGQLQARALLHLPGALASGAAGSAEQAARLQGFALAYWHRSYGPPNPIEARELRRTRRLLHHRLGNARLTALAAQGLLWTLPQAQSEAMKATIEDPA